MAYKWTHLEGLMKSCRRFVAVVLAAGLTASSSASAQSSAQGHDRKESLAFLTKIASRFEIRLDDKRRATRDDEPAMRWTNTIGHTTDAALFFWMHDGRPVAVGTAFETDRVAVGLEFQSLALEPLEARRDGKSIWGPRQPGIEFRPIANAPKPAETARVRLSQIKSLARRFRAQAIKSPPAYQENDARELRLLAQPILQYHDAEQSENDGAVFAFAMDTDVDVLLLIENRVRDGKSGWEFALARTNPFVLKVWCDKTLVWSQERVSTTADAAQPYFMAGPFPDKEE
jgi:hypothetical protein